MLGCNLAKAPCAHGNRVRPRLHRRDNNFGKYVRTDVRTLALTPSLCGNRNLLELIARRLTLRRAFG